MNQEEMEYQVVRGTAKQVDITLEFMLNTGWQIISETDSRTTGRKFSGGKAVGGAVLFGPVGLLAGGIGKNTKSGEVTVRLQRPFSVRDKYEAEAKRIEAEKQAAKEAKRLEKQKHKAEQKLKPMSQRIDEGFQNSPLSKSPISTAYWYKKFRNKK